MRRHGSGRAAGATVIVAAPLLLCSACGYHLAGRGTNLPDHIRRIAIPVFKISSFDFNLEHTLTEAVKDEFLRRGNLEIVNDPAKADAVLRGIIKRSDYRVFGGDQRSDSQVRIYFVVSVTLYDQVREENYFEDENYVFNRDYFIPGDIGAYQANREKAYEEAAEDFAKQLVGTVVEGF